VYAGELIRDSVGEERGMLVIFYARLYWSDRASTLPRKYNAFGKTYLFDIDCYYLRQENPDWEVSYVVDAYHAGNVGFHFIFMSVLVTNQVPVSILVHAFPGK